MISFEIENNFSYYLMDFFPATPKTLEIAFRASCLHLILVVCEKNAIRDSNRQSV